MKYGIGRVEGQGDSPSLIIISLVTIPRKKYYTIPLQESALLLFLFTP